MGVDLKAETKDEKTAAQKAEKLVRLMARQRERK